MRMRGRRGCALLSLALLLSLLAAGCGSSGGGSDTAAEAGSASTGSSGTSTAGETTTLKVAYGNETIDFVNLMVADGEGFYKRNGLDVELIDAKGTKSPTLLASHRADMAVSDAVTFLAPDAQGAHFVMLSADLNSFTFKLVGSNAIADVAGLRGKTLALSSPGGSVDVAGHAMLRKFGLGKDDVKIVYIPDVPARLAALSNGSVDAMIASPPVAPVVGNGDKNHVIYDLANLPMITISSWTTRDFAESHVDALTRYLKANIESAKFIKDPANKEKVLKYIADLTGFTDKPSLEESYETLQKEWQIEPLIDPAALDASVEQVKATTGKDVDKSTFLFTEPLTNAAGRSQTDQ